MIRIVLADDHAILRSGLKMMLNAQPDMGVIGEAQNGAQAITEAERLHPDIVLMDITMPDMNGFAATKQLKQKHSDIKVLILTMHEHDGYVFQAVRAGASGYVVKEAADTELITALRTIAEGKMYLSPGAQSLMVGDYLQRLRSGQEKESYNGLTDREQEVLLLVAEGLTNNQIAERLVISPKTVDTHRTHIMDKLDLHNRIALVKYALQHGIIES